MQRTAQNDEIKLQSADDYSVQDQLLPGVSRTFALTIPQLPPALAKVVTNAYLLCRIADTIEDDAQLNATAKALLEQNFLDVVTGTKDPHELTLRLMQELSAQTPQAEKQLIQEIPTIIRCLNSFNTRQRQSLQRCVKIMSLGMSQFQRNASIGGLSNISELTRYCYYVAGVVGEMLTELFCDYSPAIQQHYSQMMSLALSFGQGLQMTNVLKDVWDDYQRGICWYPRDIFQQQGIELEKLEQQHHLAGFETTLKKLIAITLGHLDNALHYTLLLPREELGIRRFCLWAIGIAVLTLRKLYKHPHFSSGAQVKVSRRSVKTTIFTTNLCAKNNTMLKCLFQSAAFGLPKITQTTTPLFTEWFNYE